MYYVPKTLHSIGSLTFSKFKFKVYEWNGQIRPYPLYWVSHPVGPLGVSRQNGQGRDHSMTLWSGVGRFQDLKKKESCSTNTFGHYYECIMILHWKIMSYIVVEEMT
jgi:hypothetical protein